MASFTHLLNIAEGSPVEIEVSGTSYRLTREPRVGSVLRLITSPNNIVGTIDYLTSLLLDTDQAEGFRAFLDALTPDGLDKVLTYYVEETTDRPLSK